MLPIVVILLSKQEIYFMKQYVVKFQRSGAGCVESRTVTASSASQAKEQIKSYHNGKVTIISTVEK